MQEQLTPPADHQHIWVKSINSLSDVCQLCQWRRDPIRGELLAPDPRVSEPQITEQ